MTLPSPAILLEPRFIIVELILASALFVHYRGRVRHGFGRQLTDHSTFLAPINALIYLFSRAPAKPFQDPALFPDVAALTANWQMIRDEGMRLMEDGHVRAAVGYNDLGFNSFFRTGWKRFYLKWYDAPLASAEGLCPKTVALLKTIPTVHGAMFALLPPGGRLNSHRDPFAGSMRYHLGLSTPNSDDCFIEVDGERRGWRDGEAMVFDETFIHFAENKADTTRLILFCDIERPLHTRAATAVNRFIINHAVKATATENMPGDRVGAANKIFGAIYRVRLVGKAVKKWNRRAYYGIKYAAVAGILAWVLL